MSWFKRLIEPNIQPGEWYRVYARDFSRHYGIPVDDVIKHSAIVEGARGYIWATSTAGWDLKWFNERGYRFPRRWVPYQSLSRYCGEPGSPVFLDV